LIGTAHRMLFGLLQHEGFERQNMWHVWGEEKYIYGFGGET